MTGSLVPLLSGFVIVTGIFTSVFNNSQTEITSSIQSLSKNSAIEIASSGLYIAKETLTLDNDWEDGVGGNLYSTELEGSTDYYPMNSITLNQKMKDFAFNDGNLNIYISPLDDTRIKLISEGEVNGKKAALAMVFNKITNNFDGVPAVYSGRNSNMSDITLCSYTKDENGILQGKTNPNVSLYMDSNFQIDGLDLDYGTTNTDVIEKSLKLFVDPSDYVNAAGDTITRLDLYGAGGGTGELVYDEIHSTGDVGLFNGATADNVYANGSVVSDYASCLETFSTAECGESREEFIEGLTTVRNSNLEDSNDEYQHPDFAEEIADNNLVRVDNNKVLVCGTGDYSDLLPDISLERTNPYTDPDFNKIDAWDAGYRMREYTNNRNYEASDTGGESLCNNYVLNQTSYTTLGINTEVLDTMTCSYEDIDGTHTMELPSNYIGGCEEFTDLLNVERIAWKDGFDNYNSGTFCDLNYPENGFIQEIINRDYASEYELDNNFIGTVPYILTVKNIFLNYSAGFDNTFGYYWANDAGTPLSGKIVYPSTKWKEDDLPNSYSGTKIDRTGEFLDNVSIRLDSKPTDATQLGFFLVSNYVGKLKDSFNTDGSLKSSPNFTLKKNIGTLVSPNWVDITNTDSERDDGEDYLCVGNETYPTPSITYTDDWNVGFTNYATDGYCDDNYEEGDNRGACNEGAAVAWGVNNKDGSCTTRYNTLTTESNDNGDLEISSLNAVYVEYFNISGLPTTLTNPIATDILTETIDWDWDNSSPSNVSGVNNDFGMRTITELNITERGNYKFYIKADDKKRLFIDGSLVNFTTDTWTGGYWNTEYSSDYMYLSEGRHQLIFEMFDTGGGADARVKWEQENGFVAQTIPITNLFLPEELYNLSLSTNIEINSYSTSDEIDELDISHTFDFDDEGWSGDYWYSKYQYILLYGTESTSRDFNFGPNNRNKNIILNFRSASFTDRNNSDVFKVKSNGTTIVEEKNDYNVYTSTNYTLTTDNEGKISLEFISGATSYDEPIAFDNLSLIAASGVTYDYSVPSDETLVSINLDRTTDLPDGLVVGASSSLIWSSIELVEDCENGQGFKKGILSPTEVCSNITDNDNEETGCELRRNVCPLDETEQVEISKEWLLTNFYKSGVATIFEETGDGSDQFEYMGKLRKYIGGFWYELTVKSNFGYGWIFSNPNINKYNKSWEVKGIEGHALKNKSGNTVYDATGEAIIMTEDMYLWEDLNGGTLTGDQWTDLNNNGDDRDIGYEISINREIASTANAYCKLGKDYAEEIQSICTNGYGPTTDEWIIVDIADIGEQTEFEYFIIQSGCELDMGGEDYSFDNLLMTEDSSLNITNPGETIQAINIDMAQNSGIYYSNTDENNYLTIKSENINMAGDSSQITCANTNTCLIDTNTLTNNKSSGGYSTGSIQGTVLARDTINLQGNTNFEIIGNTYAENMIANGAIFCNVVDENGSQIVNEEAGGFLDIVDPTGGSYLNFNTIPSLIMKTICTDFDDCVNSLSSYN